MRGRAFRVLLLGLLALALLPAAASARSLRIVNAHVSLGLANDASLLVNERLTFKFEGTWEGAYRDILLKHGETLTDIKVSEDGRDYDPGGDTALGSHDRPGVYGATSIPDGGRIVWHYAATDEEKTFDVSYRVINGAVAYNDVIDVLWQVWGDQWKFGLPRLSADLRDAALNPNNPDYRVWGHPRSVQGTTARLDGIAKLQARNVPDHQFVEMRVTIPRKPGQDVSGARHGDGDGVQKILSDEKDLDNNYNSTYSKSKRFLAHHVVPVGAALAALALFLVGLLRFAAREHEISTPEYVPEPPDDASPALAYALAHEGGDSSNTVLATFLDLIERGFYDTKTATTDKEKLDLSVSKAGKRPSAEKLEPHEKAVLDFFDELLGDESVPFSDMKDKIPKHSSEWREKWGSMTSALNNVDEGKLQWDRDLNGLRGLVGLGVAVGFLVLTLAYNSVEKLWFLPVAMGAVTLAVLGLQGFTRFKRLAPEYRERSSKWSAFEHWTHDFPTLKDDPPATLELWKKILIYGVAFGTAERMIKSGRIPAPVMESSGSAWTGYMIANPGGSFDGGSFSSGFSSQVAPESSGGGGGFSGGGGGGGSGGGGGGGW